jgi:kynurenine formamidase
MDNNWAAMRRDASGDVLTGVIDLSHPIAPGMPMYPGLPGPEIEDHMSRVESESHYAPGTSFQVSRIRIVGSTGTYIDSPFHRFAEGGDVSSLSLGRLVNLPGVVVEPGSEGGRLVLREPDLEGLSLKGRAVLVRTGHDLRWGREEYYGPGPYVSAGAARFIAGADAALVGIDCLNIDDTGDSTRPAHTLLLASGIPVVENLRNLGALPREGFRFFAAPVAIRGAGSAPVRAFALVAV